MEAHPGEASFVTSAKPLGRRGAPVAAFSQCMRSSEDSRTLPDTEATLIRAERRATASSQNAGAKPSGTATAKARAASAAFRRDCRV